MTKAVIEEAALKAAFVEAHADALADLQELVGKIVDQGGSSGVVAGMLIGAGTAVLVATGSTPADIRGYVAIVVDKVIGAPRA